MYRVILGIVLSIVITTLDGFILGSMGINPNTGKGYWDAPYIFASLVVISVFLFIIGWYRGAYPLLSRKKPKTETLILPKKDKEKFYTLMDKWKKLHRKFDKYNDLLLDSPEDEKEKYKEKISKITEELEKLEKQMVQLGEKEIPIIKALEKEKKALNQKKDK